MATITRRHCKTPGCRRRTPSARKHVRARAAVVIHRPTEGTELFCARSSRRSRTSPNNICLPGGWTTARHGVLAVTYEVAPQAQDSTYADHREHARVRDRRRGPAVEAAGRAGTYRSRRVGLLHEFAHKLRSPRSSRGRIAGSARGASTVRARVSRPPRLALKSSRWPPAVMTELPRSSDCSGASTVCRRRPTRPTRAGQYAQRRVPSDRRRIAATSDSRVTGAHRVDDRSRFDVNVSVPTAPSRGGPTRHPRRPDWIRVRAERHGRGIRTTWPNGL